MKKMKNTLFLLGALLGMVFSVQLSAQNQPTTGTVGPINVGAVGSSTTYYDSGGPGGSYISNENGIISFCPNDAATEAIQVDFVSFNTETGWDYLYVYDSDAASAGALCPSTRGASVGGFPAGGFSGANLAASPNGGNPFTMAGPTGCVTFEFLSDGSGTRVGWEATITTVAKPAGGDLSITVNGAAAASGSTVDVPVPAGACVAPVSVMATSASGAAITNDFNGGGADASGDYDFGMTTVTFFALPAGQLCPVSANVTINAVGMALELNCPGDLSFNLLPGECNVVVDYTIDFRNCNAGGAFAYTTNAASSAPGGNTFDQAFFDVINGGTDPIVITSFDQRLFASGTADWKVHSIAGTFNGNTGNPGAWTLNSDLVGVGSTVPSVNIPVVTPITVAPGASVGISISFPVAQTNTFFFNVDFPTVATNVADANGVRIDQNGAMQFQQWIPTLLTPRGWFGTMNYEIQCPNTDLTQTDGSGLTSGDRFPIGTTTQSYSICECPDPVTGVQNCLDCTFDITVNEYPFPTTTLTCNDDVQVSLAEDGCTLVGADMVLEGGPYGCYDNFVMTRTPAGQGCPTPPVDGAVYVGCNDIGRTITVRVTDPNTGSSCWGKLHVEDKLAPEVIECPDYTVACTDQNPGAVQVVDPANSIYSTSGPSTSGTTNFTINVPLPASATINDVDVHVRTVAGSLGAAMALSVIHPDGTEVVLFPNNGCINFAGGLNFIFDDDAGLPVYNFCNDFVLGLRGNTPVSGSLTTLEGKPAAGVWTIRIANAGLTYIPEFLALEIDHTGGVFDNSPVFDDNCNIISITSLDDMQGGSCATNAGVITRVWTARDQSGNETRCTQTITIERPTLTQVTFPEDYDGIENPVLDCSSPYPDTGAAVCIKDTALFEFQAPDAAIPDNTGAALGVTFDLNGPVDGRTIKDINIRVDIQHANVSHLKLALQKLNVNGAVVAEAKLFDMNFNLGWLKCSVTPLNDMNYNFDDEGCALPHEPCVDWAPTIKGQYPGLEALSELDDQPVNGHVNADWRLVVLDTVTGTAGRVRAMEVVYQYTDEGAITNPLIAGNPFYNGDACNFTRSFTDEVIDVCPTSYKVLRHWTVIDWCTGERRTHTQLIKVLDTCPPVIECPRTRDNDDDALLVPVYTPANASSIHGTCVGHLTVPALDVCYENCSGVEAWNTRLYSSDGALLLGEVNGNGGLFRDVALDLDEGFDDLAFEEPDARYLVRYTVWDNCNNKSSVDVYIRVVDRVAPTPICREVTQLALTGDLGDTTTLCANTLDEGSYDNCSDVHFFVREMVMNQTPADVDPIGGPFGDPELNFEILGDSRAGGCSDFKLAVNYKYKSCIGFTCEDAGEENQVFLLVVDDYVYNYVNDYLNNTLPIFDAVLNYNCFPLVILPKDKLDNEPAFDQLNGGERYWEFYLSTADFLPTAEIWEGHYNFCMVEVLVEDKVRPVCAAPDDVWTTCADIPANVDLTDTTQLQNLFGNATAWDNCIVNTEELRPNVDVDLCGVGQVTRRFRARDNAGNISIGTCQQTIMIMEVHSYEIDIPGDFEDECTTVSPDSLVYREFGCDLIGVNVSEEEFPASANGECKKIFRTYKIINWCEYDGVSDPLEIPRLDLNRDGIAGDGFTPSNPGSKFRANYRLISNGDYVYLNIINDPVTRLLVSTGYYEYVQHIKIYDDTAPELTDTLSGPFCGGDLDEDPCTGEVDLIPVIVETCTDVTVTWQLDAFSSTFVTADFSGENNLTGRYPLGTHTARFRVADDCGNTSQIDITFDIIDCKAPTPVCYNGLSIDLMPSGMVELWASDFDASSYDYCYGYEVRINRIEDRNGDGFITADDYLTTPPSTDSIVARCKDLGILYVQMWVHELSGDGVNDWDYCVTFVEVQDNLGACTGSKVSVGGKITNEENESVDNVEVQLSTGATAMTGNDGEYVFGNLAKGDDYTVTPSRDDNPLNGVSTFDLVLISKHILNVKRLDSAYKVIAADANNSQTVTTLDLVALRKLILRVSNELPNNTSWRFVDKSHVFVDAQNPWNFPEVKNFNDLAVNELNANFIAVKVGDVNGDAVPNSALGVGNRSFNGNLVFSASQQAVKAGEEFSVEFVANQNVLGYQFTLDYNEKAVELVDVVDGVAKEALNFNVDAANGQIATSWNEDKELQERPCSPWYSVQKQMQKLIH
ncbi:MAG: hypothetical protein R2784_06915 [Saprospiraceae bacterium]